MIPTPKLRFIERKDFTQDIGHPRTLKILQQWWQDVDFDPSSGEWRDVPLEKEHE